MGKRFLNHAQLAGRDPLHQSLYMWAKTALPGYILTMLGDRMEMAHSVEGRVPFLDHHLVDVIRSQPVNQKVRGMTEKYVTPPCEPAPLTGAPSWLRAVVAPGAMPAQAPAVLRRLCAV